MPNCAECRTARNAEPREMPNRAKCRRAPNAKERRKARLASRAVWHLALSGISRRSAFGAFRHVAPLMLAPLIRFADRCEYVLDHSIHRALMPVPDEDDIVIRIDPD